MSAGTSIRPAPCAVAIANDQSARPASAAGAARPRARRPATRMAMTAARPIAAPAINA